MNRPQIDPPDLDEKGAPRDGVPQTSDKRLFMQLHAFGGCLDTAELVAALDASGLPGVLYADANDPTGVAFLTWSDDPEHFVGPARDLLNGDAFTGLLHKPEYTMFGRTYALGHEPDLAHWLLRKPIDTVTMADAPWAVWYPLRRKGEFETLEAAEQRGILMEHGKIGMSFVAGEYAYDVRLACHGIDTHDNDFVIGLIGKALFPLSAIVQTMRKTKQTSQYLEGLGPFFVGKAVWAKGG